jgi:vacuolar-type H+-ATPase subunit I/STV1
MGSSCSNRSENVMWIRGIAGVIFCALGALWIAQGSGAMKGSGMSGHGSFALLGVVAVIVGLALLAWAALVRRRRAST